MESTAITTGDGFAASRSVLPCHIATVMAISAHGIVFPGMDSPRSYRPWILSGLRLCQMAKKREKKGKLMQTHNHKKWKYTVKYSKKLGGVSIKNSWDSMVKFIAKKGLLGLEDVTFCHPDCPGGSAQIPGNLMLMLWKAVAAYKPN
jgi:hypothetical protein